MRKRCLVVVLWMVCLAVGCGKSTDTPDRQKPAPTQKDRITIRNVAYPVYPKARVHQDLKISVSFTVDAAPSEVKSWYDKKMTEEGWRATQDWAPFGGQDQKTFLRGKALRTPDFAEEMVKFAVGPHKTGGTFLALMPVVNKYRTKGK